MSGERRRRASTSSAARAYRKKGIDVAKIFAQSIGLSENFSNDPQSKKDVIDANGMSHSIKGGDKKWQIFLYGRNRFESDSLLNSIDGISKDFLECIDSFPRSFSEYESNKEVYKDVLEDHILGLSEKLKNRDTLSKFLYASFFNGKEVDFLTVFDNDFYHVFSAKEIVDVVTNNVKIKTSQAMTTDQRSNQKVILEFNNHTLGEIEMRNDSQQHYQEVRFNMLKPKAMKLFYTSISGSKKLLDNVMVHGEAINKFCILKEDKPSVETLCPSLSNPPINSSTFLLTWNPALWEWVEYSQFLEGTIKLPIVRCWSTQSHKNVKIGDEVFLMLLDEDPEHKGIIAWGYVTQEPFEDLHWDKGKRDKGIKTYFIQCTFHEIINIEKYSALRRHQLIKAYPDQHWAPQGSGIQIQDHIASELKEVWRRHYERNSDAETNAINDEPVVYGAGLSDSVETLSLPGEQDRVPLENQSQSRSRSSNRRQIIESLSSEPLTIERVAGMVRDDTEYFPENEKTTSRDGDRFQRLIEINSSSSDMDVELTGIRDTRDLRRLVEKVFCEFPLIGNYTLTDGQISQLIENSKEIISRFFRTTPPEIDEKAIITLTLVSIIKGNPSISSDVFWRYFINQLGYQESYQDNKLYSFLTSCVHESLTGYNRLFIKAPQNRDFRTTLLAHAMSPKEDWFRFFDFVAEFYRNNLGYVYDPNDRVVDTLSQIIQEKYLHSEIKSDDIETRTLFGIHIGLVSIMVLRPKYMTLIIHQVLSMLDSVTNRQRIYPTTYLQLLFNQWHRNNLDQITFVEKERRVIEGKADTRPVTDYSRIQASWCVDDQNNLGVMIPSFRVKKPRINQVRLNVESVTESSEELLNVYGNSFGKTCEQHFHRLKEASNIHPDRFKVRIRLNDGSDEIFDSGTTLYRDEILIEGHKEVGISSELVGEYLLFTYDIHQYRFHKCTIEVIDEQKGCYFLNVNKDYAIFRGNQIISSSDEKSTDVHLYADYHENLVYISEGVTFEVVKQIDPMVVQLKANQREQSILVKVNQEILHSSDYDQRSGKITYPVDNLDLNTPLTILVFDQTEQRVMYQKRIIWIMKCEVSFDQPYYWLSGKDAIGYIKVYEQELPLTIESDEYALAAYDAGYLRVQIPVIRCLMNDNPIVNEDTMIWYEDINVTDTLRVIAPGYRSALVAGNHLINANSSDELNGVVYPLGVDIRNLSTHHDIDVAKTSVKLNTLSNQNIDEIVLFTVHYKPKFVEPIELVYEDYKLSWNVPHFIGGTGQLSIEVQEGMKNHRFDLAREATLITDHLEIDEGVHSYHIYQETTSLFSPPIEICKGTLISGDLNRFRFISKRLHLTSIRVFTDSFELSDKYQTYISDLSFQKMGEDPEIPGEFPVYFGKLYYNSRYEKNRKIRLIDENELDEGLDVNSVRVIVINKTTAYITDAEADGLLFDVRMMHLVDHVLGDDPDRYKTPDFFDYNEEEDPNVQPNQSIA